MRKRQQNEIKKKSETKYSSTVFWVTISSMAIILIFFLQSALFAFYHLHIRKLEERGVSAHAIAGLQRYSIIPAIILIAVTYGSQYVSILLANPFSVWWILGIAVFWGIGQYVGYVVLDSASSLSMVATIGSFVEIPIVIAIAILVNHDFPNPSVLIAIGLFLVAILIKPTQHSENKRPLLKYTLFIVLALMITSQIGHSFDGAFYKNILHLLHPRGVLFGISIYIFTTSLTLNIIYLLPGFKKPSADEKAAIKKYSWVAYSIPLLWFIASLPEGYSFSNMPLFTMSALGAFSFLIKLVSDLKNKRLVLDFRTIIFAVIVIASIVFSALSLR